MTEQFRIDRIVNSVEDQPHYVLGPCPVEEGIEICCFFPGKEHVMLKTLKDKQNHTMTMLHPDGFFRIVLPMKVIPDYIFVVQEEGLFKEYRDPYAFPLPITWEDQLQFRHGICYQIYDKLGAHPMRVRNINGTHFAVWAPNAVRVSVVGDFNNWDGRMYPMMRHEASGIFELFLPKVKPGTLYKYEIKLKDGLTYLKADPYANAAELRPGTASVVTNLKRYQWNDRIWMKERKKYRSEDQPISIFEVQLDSFMQPMDDREFCNYKEIAPVLAKYVKEMGYTHVQLLPIMEHPLDQSLGYQTSGYYAPTSRYGTPQDFMEFVDYLHKVQIGVILEWVPDRFAKDAFALGAFDGTRLYEDSESWETYKFRYECKQVSNFLIANAMFWAEKYHIDGLFLRGISSMLYLEQERNIYDGIENLAAIEFIKHLNSMMDKLYPDVVMIAEDTSGWPRITENVKNGGLGFDYAVNVGWKKEFLSYMQMEPLKRSNYHNNLTFSMVYAYSEKFLLALSHNSGIESQELANIRAAYAYMFCHPGKKSLFMGQDDSKHPEFQFYMKKLLSVYRSYPALYSCDYETDGFEWINAMEGEKCVLSFVRVSKDKKQTLLIVCNFSEQSFEDYHVGIPFAGKCKEILNTDAKLFGGSGNVNVRIKKTKAVECDGREQSIAINLAPLSVTVFDCRKG